MYAFSFRSNPSWTRSYVGQAEIQEYLRRCARESGVWPHIRFDADLLDADWDSKVGRWSLRTARGSLTADFLVLGSGAMSEPARPDIPGLDRFAGTTRTKDNPVFSRVRGRDSVSLSQTWAEGMRSHLATCVSGFPNLFLLQGPDTVSYTSTVFMIECQIKLISAALHHLAKNGLRRLEVQPEVEQGFTRRVTGSSENAVVRSGCTGEHLEASGRSIMLWPESPYEFRRATRRFRPADYELLA